jgi:hypothetical protein
MSGSLWVAALITSRTMHRKATERKNVIMPVTNPIPALRKNFFIKKTVKSALNWLYVKIIP